MNRSIARLVNAAIPRNVQIVDRPGPAKATPPKMCARCRVTNVPLKAFEERFSCAPCWRACRARFRRCASVLRIQCRELSAKARHYATDLADGEAVMPWHWSVAAEMVLLDAGVDVPFYRPEEHMPMPGRTASH